MTIRTILSHCCLAVMFLLFGTLTHAQDNASENEDAAETAYRLGSGDRILVKVFGEEDLSVSVILDNTGKFNYPFLGEVDALELSIAELEDVVTAGLKGPYLLNPEVTVLIEEYRPFYLNGEVVQPGGYPYRPGLTLEKALTLAGGLTERASRKKINVVRSMAKDRKKQRIRPEEPVYPGDIITVQRSFF